MVRLLSFPIFDLPANVTLGIFTTLLIPETKRKTLEELAGEVPGTPNYDPETAGHRKSSVLPDHSSGERDLGEKAV